MRGEILLMAMPELLKWYPLFYVTYMNLVQAELCTFPTHSSVLPYPLSLSLPFPALHAPRKHHDSPRQDSQL